MSKEKGLYTSRVADSVSVDVIETADWSPVSLENQFARQDVGGTKMKKIDIASANANAKDVRLFCLLKVADPSYKNVLLCREIGALNADNGFTQCIDVKGDEFSFKQGALIRVTGKTVSFSVAK